MNWKHNQKGKNMWNIILLICLISIILVQKTFIHFLFSNFEFYWLFCSKNGNMNLIDGWTVIGTQIFQQMIIVTKTCMKTLIQMCLRVLMNCFCRYLKSIIIMFKQFILVLHRFWNRLHILYSFFVENDIKLSWKEYVQYLTLWTLLIWDFLCLT